MVKKKSTAKSRRPAAGRKAGRAADRSATRRAGAARAGGGWRKCEAPGCDASFRPKSDRQIYCSPACKVRAFYWKFKDEHGERYAARYERGQQAGGSAGRGRRPAAGRGRRKGAAGRTRTRRA